MPERHLGLRGSRLINFMILVVVCPAYILLGYNNAVFGGLLTLPSFLSTFPSIDTVNTSGSTAAENARIQGGLFSVSHSKALLTTLYKARWLHFIPLDACSDHSPAMVLETDSDVSVQSWLEAYCSSSDPSF